MPPNGSCLKFCPRVVYQCGKNVPDEVAVCPHCGAHHRKSVACRACQAEIAPGESACLRCGTPLGVRGSIGPAPGPVSSRSPARRSVPSPQAVAPPAPQPAPVASADNARPGAGKGKLIAVLAAAVVLLGGAAAAAVALARRTDADCRRESACAAHGLCVASDQQCVAASSADCRASAACASEGECSAKDGRCVVASDADCAAQCEKGFRCLAREGHCVCDPSRAYACKELGLCGADSKGYCTVATLEGCKASKACAERGLCSPSAKQDACVVASDADCAGSQACTTSGKCAAKDGACVLSDCTRSGDCALRGGCTMREGRCAPAKVEDCAGSAWCKSLGLCGFSEGRCVPTEAGCKGSDGCRDKSECFTGPGMDRCMTRSALDEELKRATGAH